MRWGKNTRRRQYNYKDDMDATGKNARPRQSEKNIAIIEREREKLD